jgi:hypothetical protein
MRAMLIPLHLVPVPVDEPPGLGDPGHAWQGDGGLKIAAGVRLGDIRALGLTVAGATSAGVGSRELLRFGQLMNDAGLAINPTRMLYDRAYACERLIEALRHGGGELQRLAEDLFDAYQAAGEWIGLAN